MTNAAPDLFGLILCGGAGTRVGGADKPLLRWKQHTLLDCVIARLAPQVQSIHISANRSIDQYQRRGTVVQDRWPNYQGPVAGIASVLLHCRDQRLANAPDGLDVPAKYLVCPGDMPLLPDNLGQRLSADFEIGKPRFVHDGSRAQPLCMLCDDSLLPSLVRYMEGPKRSVMGWLEACGAEAVEFSDTAAFDNLNTLEQLRAQHAETSR